MAVLSSRLKLEDWGFRIRLTSSIMTPGRIVLVLGGGVGLEAGSYKRAEGYKKDKHLDELEAFPSDRVEIGLVSCDGLGRRSLDTSPRKKVEFGSVNGFGLRQRKAVLNRGEYTNFCLGASSLLP